MVPVEMSNIIEDGANVNPAHEGIRVIVDGTTTTRVTRISEDMTPLNNI
jgi:hypothetical protein